MNFVILDESTSATAGSNYGGSITPEYLAQITEILNIYCNRDVANYYGGSHNVRLAANPTDILTGEIVSAIMDTLPDVPGAVAYHDVDNKEVPVIFLARDQCSSLLSGPGSVLSAFSHEFGETIGDEFCNAWVLNNDGKMWAKEVCDPVQEWGYSIDIESVSGSVSDFVLPCFFGPGSTGPYNYCSLFGQSVSAPMTLAPGGYAIIRDQSGNESQIFGEIGKNRMVRKKHWNSRTYRRGVRL